MGTCSGCSWAWRVLTRLLLSRGPRISSPDTQGPSKIIRRNKEMCRWHFSQKCTLFHQARPCHMLPVALRNVSLLCGQSFEAQQSRLSHLEATVISQYGEATGHSWAPQSSAPSAVLVWGGKAYQQGKHQHTLAYGHLWGGVGSSDMSGRVQGAMTHGSSNPI